MSGRVLLLVNHRASRCVAMLAAVEARLRGAGIDYLAPRVQRKEDVCQTIERHAGEIDRIVIVGGDGSIHTALPGVLKAKLPLGVVPGGTANDLARTLGLPLDADAAIVAILRGRRRAVDVGLVNDIPFINAASLGLTTSVTHNLDRPLKKRFGVLAYAIATAKALSKVRPFEATVRTPEQRTRLWSVQVVIGNGRHFGSGMTVDESATIDDGLLHLYSIGTQRWWNLVSLLPALMRGTHGRDRRVHNVTASHIELQTRPSMTISADGEFVTRTPARFGVMRGALEIFLPDEASETAPGLSGGAGERAALDHVPSMMKSDRRSA
jgi:diacylglycerol kinase (ATP)